MRASVASLWETIATEAERESPLWAAALRPEPEREETPVFSPLTDERFALGIESIYEGYLLHYGRPRLFSPADRDAAILLGDYLYAHGLVRITALGDVEAVERLAELLSLCAHLRAEERGGDGEAWASTVAALDDAEPDSQAVERALALHAERVD
ncbi:MAG TPA: hypothetical protein VGJ34_00690 [Gaiellaceae bacterium]